MTDRSYWGNDVWRRVLHMRGGPLDDATPTTHATPAEGNVQDRCTLTAEEREAIVYAMSSLLIFDPLDADAQNTLRNLLARLT